MVANLSAPLRMEQTEVANRPFHDGIGLLRKRVNDWGEAREKNPQIWDDSAIPTQALFLEHM